MDLDHHYIVFRALREFVYRELLFCIYLITCLKEDSKTSGRGKEKYIKLKLKQSEP